MRPRRDIQKLLLIAVLGLAAVSPLIQAVGAPFFFDGQIILHMKANPALRIFLARDSTKSLGEVRVLLVFSNVPSLQQIQELRALGTLETFTGHVATMHLPLRQLPQIASLDFVNHVSYPRQLKPQLDKSVPEILADKVWNTVRDASGNSVNGTGVVVGIVDTGIDYNHRDFFFENGTSKIISLWDQSVSGKTPAGFDYGNECTRSEIGSGICSEVDGETNGFDPGHGTAVAAVASSSGQASALFQSCIRYDGVVWHDDAQLCGDSNAPAVLLASPTDYRYFGTESKFNHIFLDLQSPGKYVGFTWEYSQGEGRWGTLLVQTNETSELTHSGTVYFTPPGDWMNDTVDGRVNQYWVRLKAEEVQAPAKVLHAQTNPPYFGVAPGALLIPVKLRDGSDESILDGINYIARKARELGLPFVINDSFGDSEGSHDGTEPLELALTDLASQGVPVVVAAGNSRNFNLHADGRLSPGESVTVPWFANQAQSQSVDLWYSVTDDIGITVRTPDGTNVSGPTPDSGVNTPDGNVIITPDERPTGKEWWIGINSTSSLRWTFTLTAITVEDGEWNAWTEPGQFGASPGTASPSLYKIDPSDTIDFPGTARGVITVGYYMTKYFWWSGCSSCIDYTSSIGVHGIWWIPTTASGPGNITFLSGKGPTRDGRTKPDLVAPGANIAAARATNRPERHSDPDNYHQIFRGSSFSAPHVAGVIALMLQMNPYLTPNEIRSILTKDARQDKFTGTIDKRTGSPLWGWGKVNALNSTLDATTVYAIRVEIEVLGRPVTTNLILDGQNIAEITLNQTRTEILEFQRDGNHTLGLTPIIQVDPGTRYSLTANTWTFSSGGAKRFQYQLQFLLQVTSAYGYGTGTGWYDANSTAIASVIVPPPSVIQGYQFQGWTGAVTSDSPMVQIRMDSSKQVIALWEPVPGPRFPGLIIGLIVAIAVSVAVALLVRYKRTGTQRKP